MKPLTDLIETEGPNIQRVHLGDALADAVAEAEAKLPSGSVLLLAESDEALAVAAGVTVHRGDPTRWERFGLGRPLSGANGDSPVIIEVGSPPAAWWAIVKERFPKIPVVLVGEQRSSG